ncbi:hypothetical protein WN55_06631, partial [Dufourea novaeangliae]
PPHFAIITRQFLNEKFGNKWNLIALPNRPITPPIPCALSALPSEQGCDLAGVRPMAEVWQRSGISSGPPRRMTWPIAGHLAPLRNPSETREFTRRKIPDTAFDDYARMLECLANATLFIVDGSNAWEHIDNLNQKWHLLKMFASCSKGIRQTVGSPSRLDDTALQLYKDGDYGAYLDLEASISEQQEEFEGFQTK